MKEYRKQNQGGYMKKLLKKNQIIITALAIMIAIAGYLNLTKDSVTDEKNKLDNVIASNDYEKYTEDVLLSENDLTDASLEISDEDNADNTYEVTSSGNGDLILSENNAEKSGMLEEQSIPGEAVLASTTISGDYFSSAKLKREQIRSKNKTMLMDLLSDASATEEQRDIAFNKIVALAEIAEIENSTELLLEAKGFDGAVVSIVDNTVDVVINAVAVTDGQIAQIEDIVIRKTGMAAENIVVSAVVAQD